MSRRKKLLLILAGIFTVTIGLGVFFLCNIPCFKYDLLTSKPSEEAEYPLEVEVYENSVKLQLAIVGRVGEYDVVRLKRNIRFSEQFPFIEYDRNLLLRLVDKDQKSKISQTLYTFIGYIYNLKQDEYRIRLEDTYGNLIDEIVVTVGPRSLTDIRYCESAEDCVAVTCSCNCSGCGGFPYEDVVNTQNEQKWYQEEGCNPEELVCPQVCCPPRQVVCDQNTCQVVELENTEETQEQNPVQED